MCWPREKENKSEELIVGKCSLLVSTKRLTNFLSWVPSSINSIEGYWIAYRNQISRTKFQPGNPLTPECIHRYFWSTGSTPKLWTMGTKSIKIRRKIGGVYRKCKQNMLNGAFRYQLCTLYTRVWLG